MPERAVKLTPLLNVTEPDSALVGAPLVRAIMLARAARARVEVLVFIVKSLRGVCKLGLRVGAWWCIRLEGEVRVNAELRPVEARS
jgi:hypothetical protein